MQILLPQVLGYQSPLVIFNYTAINESKGFSISVSDEEILKARDEVSQKEGTLLCPEGAATFAAFKSQLISGTISKDESVVLFNCASGLKYPLPEVSKFIDKSNQLIIHCFNYSNDVGKESLNINCA